MATIRNLTRDTRVLTGALISLCFLLASSGWLLWLYHLTSLAPALPVDLLTMGLGYFMQALGIGAFMLTGRTQQPGRMRRMALAAIPLFVGCLVPATLSKELAAVLAFGYLANLFCGFVQGYYLTCLAWQVDQSSRGVVFGAGYALSTLCSWSLSVAFGGALMQGVAGIVTCAVIAAPSALLVNAALSSQPLVDDTASGRSEQSSSMIVWACALVVIMSVTKSVGFAFPSTDLIEGVNLELSRRLYGIGLLGAGWVGDRDRRLGAVLCAGSLVTPFLMLSLTGAAAPATVLWALGYLLFGSFAVYRVTLLADFAAQNGKLYLAGAGLLLGRVGDAIGTIVCLALSGSPLVLITVAALLFACSLALFFLIYQALYAPAETAELSERERFENFSARHDLSPREREVLRLLLDDHTNAEIAATLFVSEATVKFHVRNLLKKTGCRNRVEVIAAYAGQAAEV